MRIRTAPAILLLSSLAFLSVQAAVAEDPPAQASPVASAVERNKATVRRFYDEVWNQMKLKSVDEIFVPPFQLEPMKDTVATVHFGIPDIHFAINEIFAAEGDRIVVTFTASGTHSAELFGVAPTGKKISFSSMEIFQFKDGKVEGKENADSRLLLMQQIGALCKQPAK